MVRVQRVRMQNAVRCAVQRMQDAVRCAVQRMQDAVQDAVWMQRVRMQDAVQDAVWMQRVRMRVHPHSQGLAVLGCLRRTAARRWQRLPRQQHPRRPKGVWIFILV